MKEMIAQIEEEWNWVPQYIEVSEENVFKERVGIRQCVRIRCGSQIMSSEKQKMQR